MRHIPNIISFMRILLIPFFIWLMVKGDTFLAAIILAISGLNDLLDGYLARRFNWVSQLGKVLDPIADKLTQVTVCIIFLVKMRLYWPFFAILLAKDLVMLIMGGLLVKKGAKIEGAKWFGKVVTTLFYIVMVAILFIPTMPQWLIITLLSIVTFCAIIAGLLYIPDFLRYKRLAAINKR